MTVYAREGTVAEDASAFRSVNESIEVDYESRDAATGRHAFLCECSDEDCYERLWLSVEEYESVRAYARRFVVAPGHIDVATDTVVLGTGRYFVVEKAGDQGVIAEELDPRR